MVGRGGPVVLWHRPEGVSVSDCDPRDIAVKSFFLGPQNENRVWFKRKWNEIVDKWLDWRGTRFPGDGEAITGQDRGTPAFAEALQRMDLALDEVLKDLEGETPKFTPRYIGHMVSEVSLPALLGHVCALLHNPNNSSREVSRVTSRLEEEAIAQLAGMLGFTTDACGHFTSGGTLANFEAMWRAIVRLDGSLERQIGFGFLKTGPWEFAGRYLRATGHEFRGPVVLVPQNKHFSWEKAVSLMGLGDQAFWPVALDDEGRLCVSDLKEKIDRAIATHRPVLMVVSVAGTTEMGEVDPVDQVQDLLDTYLKNGQEIWHHVDAAYGGYYTALLDGGELENKFDGRVSRSLRAIRRVDSVTLDPHKLGYVPYSCGAFLTRDEAHYATRGFGAAYLLDNNKSRWASTLEGSRTGAGVTATWLANRTMGLGSGGYGRLLAKGLEARELMLERLQELVPDFLPVLPADLNIICFSIAPRGAQLSRINTAMLAVFEKFEHSPEFSISKTILKRRDYGLVIERLAAQRGIDLDADSWVQLRVVLMNPFVISNSPQTDFIGAFAQELLKFYGE